MMIHKTKKAVLISTIISVSLVFIFGFSVMKVSALTNNCFSDVSVGQWFHDFVCWMYDKGLTVGYPDGTYRPFNPVSRAELAVFIQRLSGEGDLGPIVDANLLDGLDSLDFATSTHKHFGDFFSGASGGYGLMIQNNGLGNGLEAFANATTGFTSGFYGLSASNNGHGVEGVASSATGATSGVYGTSSSSDGTGVYGEGKYGVSGESTAQSGTGVYGSASASTGINYGVYGTSPNGTGVYGTGYTGLYGLTDSTTGYGVYAENTALSGDNFGVWGQSHSPDGQGVGGFASSTSGFALGVYGFTASPSGYGVFGFTPDTGGTAVGGETQAVNGRGVYGNGYSAGGTGVNYGVYGRSNSSDGYGGFFVNDDTGGTGFLLAANDGMTTSDLEFKVSNNGDVYADGQIAGASFAVGSADFAEMVSPGDLSIEPGDVLVVEQDGSFVRSSHTYQSTVVGVYSTAPGILAGVEMDDDGILLGSNKIPMAIVGIVPVKASAENGVIHPGDLLVASSIPGHAMRAGDAPPIGTVIGKALEPLEAGNGVIQMLVMLQ